jgi:transcriptional regulator of acetoin/glycerol metabolism
MPVIRRLLVEDATDAGLIVAVTDAAGRLLWVEGEPGLRRRAESMHFVEGASWDEGHAGTNAPGTSLALDHSVQIFAAEHFARNVSPWSCSAAPIHDPGTGELLGALDLTGGDDVAAPQTLALVRATVAAVESELQLHRLRRPVTIHSGRGRQPGQLTKLTVLGLDRALLSFPGRHVSLRARHAELLLLLTENPDGLSVDQLAVALREHDGARVTIRAEMSRLRAALAELQLESRPYRLRQPPRTDVADVRQALRLGNYAAALRAYRGLILPLSDAPGIVTMRDELHQSIRAAALAERDPELLLELAESPAGRLDLELWQAGLLALPTDSPRRAGAVGHLAWLHHELD